MRKAKLFGSAILASPVAVLLLFGSAGVASADHTHVKVTGSGDCVIVAGGSGEASVDLPSAVFEGNPNVDIAETDGRTHPLHVLVHQGKPGENMDLYVLGSPAEATACAGSYINSR